VRFRTSALAIGAALALAAGTAGCSSGSSGSAGSSAVPASLTLWRMGPSTPSEVKWMNGVFAQFHSKYSQYKKTKINVVWIPWADRTTDWQKALATGKNAPDITELGNTDTPAEAQLGMLANIAPEVNAWSTKSDIVPGMLANDTQGSDTWAVPWFGGVRGIWYRKNEFQAAGISSPPTTWAQLVADAKTLMKKYPGSYGFGAPSNYDYALGSFIWGAGGQIAVEKSGKWTGELTTPQAEAGIKFYVDLTTTYKVSPTKYIGQTELGNPGATSGGSNEDFGLGRLGMYLDGPWAESEFPANSVDKSGWASFPIPSENGPNPAPAFAGGSDLGVFATSKYKTADWDLIQLMDNETNSTSFANLQGFFPPYTSKLTGGAYSSSQLMSGFAKAASVTEIAPFNAKNWDIVDTTDEILPTMTKALEQGAPFASTVAKANTEMTDVLNTGKES
jgi:ABC-type glycerol-3-phosphate transport system substrate-binding protein